MKINRRSVLQGAAGATWLASWPQLASGQTRAETLRYVTGATINTLDPTMPGATRESFGLSMNVYDRLFSFGRKKFGEYWTFDPDHHPRRAGQGLHDQPGRADDHHHAAAGRDLA